MIRIPEEIFVGTRIPNTSGTQKTNQIPAGGMCPYEKTRHQKMESINRYYKNSTTVYANQPLPGFTIIKSSTWRGNTSLWTVCDPRGFTIEISSNNITSILSCGSISEGLIQDKCVWGYDSGENVLIPESSSLYKSARENTKLLESKIKLSEVPIGSWVKLKSKVECVYLGSFNFIELCGQYFYQTKNHSYELLSTAKKKLLFAKIDNINNTLTYFIESTNKIATVGNVLDEFSDKDVNRDNFNKIASDQYTKLDKYDCIVPFNIFGAFNKKVEIENVNVSSDIDEHAYSIKIMYHAMGHFTLGRRNYNYYIFVPDGTHKLSIEWNSRNSLPSTTEHGYLNIKFK